MNEVAVETQTIRVRKHWSRRLLNELLALLLALLLLLVAGLVLLDTAPGHRWLADRIAGMETATGLKIEIGRIEGSVFGNSHLKNVRVSDQKGVFLTSPDILLDWAPGAWIGNRLHIDRMAAERMTLSRLPALKPTGRTGPILPGFDNPVSQSHDEMLDHAIFTKADHWKYEQEWRLIQYEK